MYRFGGKRRRCTGCGRTWSVHPGRCGRRRNRIHIQLPRRLILEHVPARQISREQHHSVSTIYRWCREAVCRSVISEPGLSGLPANVELVLIVDGLRFHVRNGRWVQYTMAFKPVDADIAYFADPLLLPGSESATNWQQVFRSIQPETGARVRALVADGLRGMTDVAARNDWVYQRCHFHIRALLRYWLGGPWVDPANDAIRWAIDDALLSADEGRADAARAAMATHVRGRPGGMSGILHQLIRDWDAVRAYLRHPELSIPTTTGVIESMHSSLRQVVSGVSTMQAILRRATAFIRLHEPFNCNGPSFQQH